MNRPCLNASLLDFLDAELTPESKVLEIGAGYSTFWFRERAGQVNSFDDDQEWAEKAGATFVHDYTAPIASALLDHYDVALIDAGERLTLCDLAWPRVKPGGVLVLDDAQRYDITTSAPDGECPAGARDVPEAIRVGRTAAWWRK